MFFWVCHEGGRRVTHSVPQKKTHAHTNKNLFTRLVGIIVLSLFLVELFLQSFFLGVVCGFQSPV